VRPAYHRIGRTVCALALIASSTRVVHGEAPVVSVWYRGIPAGVPRQDDLALIRSLGFTAVSWPAAHSAALPAIRRSARAVGLHVVVEPDDRLEGGAAVARLGDRMRIRVDRVPATHLPALLWTAIARGTRAIAFDSGEIAGHGVAQPDGQERPWVRPTVAFAGQIATNAVLFETMQPGPAVTMGPDVPADVTVALFAAQGIWVLIAASNGQEPRTVTARMSPEVPYAIWTSLLDGSTMSMLSEPAGPRLSLPLRPGQAAVYFADR
jgi:hypothetical protein